MADVTGVVQNRDAGSQYVALPCTERLAESIISLCKTELVRIDGPFQAVDELELARLISVDWFTTTRLHSSIGNLPPIEFGGHCHL